MVEVKVRDCKPLLIKIDELQSKIDKLTESSDKADSLIIQASEILKEANK